MGKENRFSTKLSAEEMAKVTMWDVYSSSSLLLKKLAFSFLICSFTVAAISYFSINAIDPQLGISIVTFPISIFVKLNDSNRSMLSALFVVGLNASLWCAIFFGVLKKVMSKVRLVDINVGKVRAVVSVVCFCVVFCIQLFNSYQGLEVTVHSFLGCGLSVSNILIALVLFPSIITSIAGTSMINAIATALISTSVLTAILLRLGKKAKHCLQARSAR